MNGGIFMCVLLVTLSASCWQRACGSSLREGSVPALLRHARSVAPAMPATDGKGSATNLGELLTKLTSRRASLRKNSTLKSRASAIRANHQLKDRDYLGWMDFGRRSAGEYEYSS
ncbi:cholecystokinin-like [Clupea harengus]|uniref:Cholecystokinin-like n=1 Tax=Clupea harengus TaxID=7950 RepID=A0A6P3VGV4_CLUHA|nr:cholecystokinin-like [Clupea harengus]